MGASGVGGFYQPAMEGKLSEVSGAEITAKALKHEGVDTLFFLTGGPITPIIPEADRLGIRCVDVRHEQAAAMMAHGYSRVTGKPGICVAASGPGTTNTVTGVANAFVDCAPILTIGGSSPMIQSGMGGFQEIDQLAMMRPVNKWSDRVLHTHRIPEMISTALRQATTGKPGPVYLDFPKDVIEETAPEDHVIYPVHSRTESGSAGDPEAIQQALNLLAKAERPIILAGTGVFWAQAGAEFRKFTEMTGVPFYTMPQTRGIIPEDHPLCFLGARSKAYTEADVVLVVGTRLNYMLAFGQAPRFASGAKFIQVDIDASEIGRNRLVDVGIVGDAKKVLEQLVECGVQHFKGRSELPWIDHLRARDAVNRERAEVEMASDQTPIHPLRLCREVRDFLDRDAILVVDGQEILNFGRQSIPSYTPGSRLNSGPFGCLGIGLPFGMAAKIARPDRQVMVLTGDGAFGLNAMELDSAVRQKVPFVTVVSNNAGWAAGGPSRKSEPGRHLGFSHYEQMAQAYGCHSEWVERPEDIRPALERAFSAGIPALVNVVVDPDTRVVTQPFSAYKKASVGTKVVYKD
jgi:thiamine pyrophosphate-dependent acetolactate synthase large subunit-like protein